MINLTNTAVNQSVNVMASSSGNTHSQLVAMVTDTVSNNKCEFFPADKIVLVQGNLVENECFS